MQGPKHGLVLGCLLLAASAYSVEVMAQVNLHDPSGTFTGLLDLVKQSASQWDEQLRGYAKTLFWLLAAIQFVWLFMPFVFRQADFGEIVGELLRFILVIGFFYALLLFSADWAEAVVESFRTAAARAAGLSETQIRPGDLFGTAIELANTVTDVETWNPLTAVMVAIAGLIVLLCFTFIAAFMGLTLIESYVVINASVLFMGFGGAQWTREYALAIVRYAVSVGAKLFILTLIVGLIVDSAKAWQAAYQHDDASLWTMVGLALVCAYLAKTIPELVASLISGSSMGGGSIIGSMATVAAAGATVAIASLAGSSIAQGFSATGNNPSHSGTGGLADALNASFNEPPQSGTAASPTQSAASGLGSRVGGMGFSGVSPSESDTRQSSGNRSNKTAPQAEAFTGGSSSSPNGSGYSLASGLTRGAGVLSAISVPGMEGAAGLSLGVEGMPPAFEPPEEESMITDAEQPNSIRPAEPSPLKAKGEKSK